MLFYMSAEEKKQYMLRGTFLSIHWKIKLLRVSNFYPTFRDGNFRLTKITNHSFQGFSAIKTLISCSGYKATAEL